MKYILTLYLLLWTYVKSSSECSFDKEHSGRGVTISGYNNDTGTCQCQITLQPHEFNYMPIIISMTHFPVDCNYSLYYWLDGYTTKIESKHENSTSIYFDLNGILYVQIENQVIGHGVLCFNFSVTPRSLDYLVDVICENLNNKTETTTTTQTTTTPTTTTPSTTTSTTTTAYPETSVVSQTVDNVSKREIDKTVSSTTIISTREQTITKANTIIYNSLLPIIMGCVIGVLVIILVILIACILIRRRNGKKSGNTQNHGTTNMEVYSSLNDELKDSGEYEQITRHQPEQVPGQQELDHEQLEQQGHVPDTSNKNANIPKKSMEGARIELNNNTNILKMDCDYENLKEWNI